VNEGLIIKLSAKKRDWYGYRQEQQQQNRIGFCRSGFQLRSDECWRYCQKFTNSKDYFQKLKHDLNVLDLSHKYTNQ
jgi:hypothetical protein